ncbi:mab-21 protein domain-containing protein [Phthorimaea operculella]|nr:mab-21 protein domain-containing protein [Phthorimaea operculella]
MPRGIKRGPPVRPYIINPNTLLHDIYVRKIALTEDQFEKHYDVVDSIFQDIHEMMKFVSPCYARNASTSNPPVSAQPAMTTNNESSVESVTSNFSAQPAKHVLQSTAVIKIINPTNNKEEFVRCLLDDGSDSSFISEHLMKKLGLESIPTPPIQVIGIGNLPSYVVKQKCVARIESLHSEFNVTLTFSVLPELTGNAPSYFVTNKQLDDKLCRFWELEEIPTKRPLLSEEEKACELHFKENTTRLENGRFCVKLPLKESPSTLVTAQLKSGCFNLRKFKSNAPDVFPQSNIDLQSKLCLSESASALGMGWCPQKDNLYFSIETPNPDDTKSVTKRSILSSSFSIFDPLGLLSPCTVSPKLLLQRVWARGLAWDAPRPDDLRRDVVLAWLRSTPSKLKSFVANKVVEICENTSLSSWRHVPTALNPADYISRGIPAEKLPDLRQWWSGPSFLAMDPTHWPVPAIKKRVDDNSPEESEESLPEMQVLYTSKADDNDDTVVHFERFSNFYRLERTYAYVLRFIHNLKNKNAKLLGPLSTDELRKSFSLLVREAQKQSFPKEYQALSKGQVVGPRSKILSLSPFINEDKVLLVGGRLDRSTYTYSKKHPIILDSKHHLTKLIFQHRHVQLMHAGPQLLLYSIRESIWPVSGRRLARSIVNACTVCRRFKGQTLAPKMGSLPPERIMPAPVFQSVAMDSLFDVFSNKKLTYLDKDLSSRTSCSSPEDVQRMLHLPRPGACSRQPQTDWYNMLAATQTIYVYLTKPNEFDIDIVIDLPLSIDQDPLHPEESDFNIISNPMDPGYIQLKMGVQYETFPCRFKRNWKEQAPVYGWRGKNKNLSSSKFMSWFKGVVNSALNEFYDGSIDGPLFEVDGEEYTAEVSESGPAMTLYIKPLDPWNDVKVDLDLVPALRFPINRWPISRGYRRLPRSAYHNGPAQRSDDFFMVVPKPSKSRYSDPDTSFRLAMHERERWLMHDTRNMRQAIRLMKKFRDAQRMDKLSSYYIKTIFFWKVDELEGNKEFWNQNPAFLFQHMLYYLHGYLKDRVLRYFWSLDTSPGNNLLIGIKRATLRAYAWKVQKLIRALEKPDDDEHKLVQVARHLLTKQEFKEYKHFL